MSVSFGSDLHMSAFSRVSESGVLGTLTTQVVKCREPVLDAQLAPSACFAGKFDMPPRRRTAAPDNLPADLPFSPGQKSAELFASRYDSCFVLQHWTGGPVTCSSLNIEMSASDFHPCILQEAACNKSCIKQPCQQS